MITLRHHLLTIVSVFLALAVGIVLGGGPLSGAADETKDRTKAASNEAKQPAAPGFSDDFAAAVAPTLVSGTLTDRQVAVVTLPGADEQVVTALTEQVEAAGGDVAARYDLSEAAVDPAQKSLVDTLGSQLLTQQRDEEIAEDATTYDRMGELLGSAIATSTPQGEDVTGRARGVTDAISGADLMAAVEDVERKAPLVLVVQGRDAADDQVDAIVAGLVTGLAEQAAGVVVAGTVADGADGQLARLRAQPVGSQVATVDGIDLAAGRTSTVLALARALTTEGGAFGASGADGAAPLG